MEAPAEHDFGLKAHRNVSCNGMSTNCLRHFTVHRQALAEHDFVLQQAIPVVEQMDAQLAERNPALQAPLARKKCALNAHFISKAHRNVPCNGMSTNCLRYLLMCNLNSLHQLICHNPRKVFYLTLPISLQPRLYKRLLHNADEPSKS